MDLPLMFVGAVSAANIGTGRRGHQLTDGLPNTGQHLPTAALQPTPMPSNILHTNNCCQFLQAPAPIAGKNEKSPATNIAGRRPERYSFKGSLNQAPLFNVSIHFRASNIRHLHYASKEVRAGIDKSENPDIAMSIEVQSKILRPVLVRSVNASLIPSPITND
jgi:hypothetical protein